MSRVTHAEVNGRALRTLEPTNLPALPIARHEGVGALEVIDGRVRSGSVLALILILSVTTVIHRRARPALYRGDAQRWGESTAPMPRGGLKELDVTQRADPHVWKWVHDAGDVSPLRLSIQNGLRKADGGAQGYGRNATAGTGAGAGAGAGADADADADTGAEIVTVACPVPILEVQSGRASFEARIAGAVRSLSRRIAEVDARPVPI